MHTPHAARKNSSSFAALLELHLKAFAWNPIIPDKSLTVINAGINSPKLRRPENANVKPA